MNRYLLPLLIFCALSVVLVVGLNLDPRRIPSPFIGKKAPSFEMPLLEDSQITLNNEDFLGEVWVLNVWASWCAACLDEHPLLVQYLQDTVKLVGLNYKDQPQKAEQWLLKWGNPYAFSLSDESGRVGLDWGIYGVPETFIIDAKGIVRYKHIGALQYQDIEETLLPLVRTLEAELK